ncbi:MAG TPA: hypothetical protein VJ739_13380 [Gemmataceae bacterium]|nr:hypothetical protein [Gemmataceae bacterium]
MVSLTVDETKLMRVLGLFVEPVELYDPTGKLIGLFVPANMERGKQIYARAAAETDWVEIERRHRSGGDKIPFHDTLARLRQLEAEIQRRQAAGERAFTTEEALAYFRSLREASSVPPAGESANGETEKPGCVTP